MTIKNGHKGIDLRRLSIDSIVAFSFIMYFCEPILSAATRRIFSPFIGVNASEVVTWLIIYGPIILLMFKAGRRVIRVDFIVLLLSVILFFAITLVVHPEYEYWYKRSDYGVWNYVLIPTEGLYAYLFVRLVNSPEKIRKYMKTSGWIMMVYYAYQIFMASTRGYWMGVSGLERAQMDHSVSMAYQIMLFAVFFIYDAIEKKRAIDIVVAIAYVAMVLMTGTRGPVLFIAVFLLILGVKEFRTTRKKLTVLVVVSFLGLILYFFYDTLMLLLTSRLSETSFRAIKTLISGDFLNDSGRSKIWEAAINMIRENPWGYGAMGSQHVITRYIYVGYPHSVILEILIDFGVVVGTAILIILSVNTVKMIFGRKNANWSTVFLLFFATACQLFISLCYWSSPAFWACIGVGMNSYFDNKKQKKAVQRTITADLQERINNNYE